MENSAFFTSLIINGGFCCIAAYYSKKWYGLKKLSRWQVFTLYGFSTLFAALIAGFGLLSVLINFYERLGFLQEFGHNATVLTSLLQFLTPIISIPTGLIVISWKKVRY